MHERQVKASAGEATEVRVDRWVGRNGKEKQRVAVGEREREGKARQRVTLTVRARQGRAPLSL